MNEYEFCRYPCKFLRYQHTYKSTALVASSVFYVEIYPLVIVFPNAISY